MILIIVEPTILTFAEYQAIHQQQERQRYPSTRTVKPVTSDSWRRKAQLWAAFVATSGMEYWWLGSGQWFSWAIVATAFTGLGLAHQWFEYRQAFLQHSQEHSATGFELDADMVVVVQSNQRRTFSWQDFYSIQYVSDWVLLYTSIEHCFYLNLKQVQAPATAADVLGLLPQRPVPAE